MKLKAILAAVTISLSASVCAHAVSAQVIDGRVGRDQLQRTVQKMLYQEKFDELEKMAADFRKTKAKLPEGAWKLVFFYKGFEAPIDKSQNGWKRFLTKFDKWLKRSPDSVTARVAAGTAWANFGWEARGSGFASTVTDEGWRLLRERLQKSYALLSQKPKNTADDCPGRYDLLLDLAKVQGWDQPRFDALFHEAVTFEPTYQTYYVAKADYLTSRWGGEEGAWKRFAEDAGKSAQGKDGNEIYARLLLSFYPQEFKSFAEPGLSWPMAKQGFLDMERKYPDSPWNLNQYCRLACAAGDKETARKLLEKIGKHPYWEPWEKGEYQKCQVLAGATPSSVLGFNPWTDTEDFRQLLQLAENGNAYAQYQVGKKYYDCGSTTYCSANVRSAYLQSIKWLTKAAEQEDAPAQMYLATIYSSGIGGTEPDHREALKWMKAAAYQGNTDAAFFIGSAYTHGEMGLKEDPVKAYIWLSQMQPPHPMRKAVAKKLTPEQLKQAEQEANILKVEIEKAAENAEVKWANSD